MRFFSKQKIKIKSENDGYTLVEMIIYVAILSIISLVITNTLVSFTRGYHTISALNEVDRSGVDVMERITRDIRAAKSIDIANSTFGSNPGVLTLIAISNGVSTTTKFYLQSGVVKVDINGVYFGPLTLSGAVVNSLIFSKLSTSVSSGVKIDMTISSTVGTAVESKNYHSTIILKGQ